MFVPLSTPHVIAPVGCTTYHDPNDHWKGSPPPLPMFEALVCVIGRASLMPPNAHAC